MCHSLYFRSIIFPFDLLAKSNFIDEYVSLDYLETICTVFHCFFENLDDVMGHALFLLSQALKLAVIQLQNIVGTSITSAK